MSFTDAMYDAMRNFYLHGIPYPAGVGMDGGEGAKGEGEESGGGGAAKLASVAEEEEEENDNDDATGKSKDRDTDDETSDNAATTKEEGVYCYPSRPAALVVTNESPPIWFEPKEVFEVAFADLSLSKTHTAAAGLVDSERGVALRFPRFKRRRPDKTIDQATTCTQIAELFAKQTKQGKS